MKKLLIKNGKLVADENGKAVAMETLKVSLEQNTDGDDTYTLVIPEADVLGYDADTETLTLEENTDTTDNATETGNTTEDN